MNVYEEAHSLSRAIKESEEYKQYVAAYDKVKENKELDEMLKDFMQKQVEVQMKQMNGEEIGQEIQDSIQKLSSIVMTDPAAAEYLQCQVRFAVMIQDVYKIIEEVVAVK